MTTRHTDYVVVGAGLLGLAAGRALALRGHEVTVLEQVSVGHPGSGSKGSCRIFRLGYDDPVYVRAARRSRDLWHSLEPCCGRILQPAPQLTIGAGLAAVREAMTLAGAPSELLPAAEAAARFPGLRLDGPALLEPESAVTAADTALAALAAGVPEIRTGVRVSALADDGRRVTLQTSDGPLAARVAVICAGPETAGLLGWTAGSAPTLEQVAYLAPARAPGPDMPILLGHEDRAPYGLPVPGSALYKTGLHHSGTPVRPGASLDQSADAELTGQLEEMARRYLPGFGPRAVQVERCVYDNTPDEDFILDRIGNVVVGCGTSGHGFKFGPLLGEWLAALATGDDGLAEDEELAVLATRWRLSRLSRPAAGSAPG
ncbi:MAG TPA: FAD-dependent oxidoreductase [Streptosporangiaceae bacterium]|nr:FAD-dependent oxidoreductase [Streptosporangiaceae bacterium]